DRRSARPPVNYTFTSTRRTDARQQIDKYALLDGQTDDDEVGRNCNKHSARETLRNLTLRLRLPRTHTRDESTYWWAEEERRMYTSPDTKSLMGVD
ncbi:hypothetical protein Trydic_g20056, partial [Trypoxylus dichotomus]